MAKQSPVILPGDVQRNLEDLILRGFSQNSIARAAGVDRKVVAGNLYGQCASLEPALQALYQVTPGKIFEAAHGRDMVPSIGSQRRLLALVAKGFVLIDLFNKSVQDIPRSNSHRASTWRRIKETYEGLEGQQGPSFRNVRKAQLQGWATPEAWSGIDMDDAFAVPHPGLTMPAWPVAIDYIEDMMQCGKPLSEICEFAGLKPLSLTRRLYKSERPELAREIYRRMKTE